MTEDEKTNSEPLAVRLEKALEKKHLFTFPGILIIIGFGLFFIFWYMSLNDILINHPALDPFVLLGYNVDIDYITVTILYFVFILVMMLIVYLLLLLPVTLFVMLGSKSMLAFGLSQDTAKIGKKFGGIQLVLRGLLPGLFGIGIGLGALPILMPLTNIPSSAWPLSFTLISTLYYGSAGLILGMALFPATWFADDAGLVIHGMLETPYRAPPRVDGAGNWLRVIFAGFTVFLYPITMIQGFILTPYLAGALSSLDLIIGIFVILIGLPLVMIGISMPFVLLTEHLQPRVVKRIRAIARKLGAKEIRFQDAFIETRSETE